MIDKILNDFSIHLGADLQTCSNHAQRVYHFSMLLSDKTLTAGDLDKLAIAAAFHDPGIWTNRTFDYLLPSVELMRDYLEKTGQPGWYEEIRQIILNHHKITPCPAEFGLLAEVFRKADWYDVFFGLYPAGIKRREAGRILKAYPRLGFHRFLLHQTWQQFLKTPLRPLPMFKW